MPVAPPSMPPVVVRLICENWPSDGFACFGGRQDIRVELSETQVTRLLQIGGTITARISAMARDGGPACATVPLLGGGWILS